MTAAVIALSVLCIALAAAALWLALDRSRQTAAAALAERERDNARAEIAGFESIEAELHEARVHVGRLTERLEQQQIAFESKRKDDEQREREFAGVFERLSNKALDDSTKRLLQLATESFGKHREQAAADLDKRREAIDALVKPISETLKRTDEKLQLIEKQRTESHARLLENINHVSQMGAELRDQTGKLVQALRKPQVRGRYGEIQLERVVEIAGMRDYCDFDTQHSVRDSAGALLRPDMVVRLPNERVIAIDAKTNIDAYLDAIEAETDEQREVHLKRFARHVLEQAKALASKDYASNVGASLDFVVMFIPGDQFVDAALQQEPSLLDYASEKGVIIASPATLIGLLRAVHVGWREKGLSDSANELFQLGRELHERAAIALSHADGLGKAINDAVTRFNKFAGSIDTRLMPTLRRFEESGAKSSKQLPETRRIEQTATPMTSLELPAGADD
jgi:DNA recombination protein RmuC